MPLQSIAAMTDVNCCFSKFMVLLFDFNDAVRVINILVFNSDVLRDIAGQTQFFFTLFSSSIYLRSQG